MWSDWSGLYSALILGNRSFIPVFNYLLVFCAGCDVVDWLHAHVEGFLDRRDARKYASQMLKAGYIRHTVNKITFSEQCYYVFGDLCAGEYVCSQYWAQVSIVLKFLFCYSALHGFRPVDFPKGRLGTSHECGDSVMFGLVLLTVSVSTIDLVTPKFQANKHPCPTTSPHPVGLSASSVNSFTIQNNALHCNRDHF